MFTFQARTWPSLVVIEQPTAFNGRGLVAYKLDDVCVEDSGHECDGCLTRTLTPTVYRGPGVKMWHPECFISELALKRAWHAWRVIRLEWPEKV